MVCTRKIGLRVVLAGTYVSVCVLVPLLAVAQESGLDLPPALAQHPHTLPSGALLPNVPTYWGHPYAEPMRRPRPEIVSSGKIFIERTYEAVPPVPAEQFATKVAELMAPQLAATKAELKQYTAEQVAATTSVVARRDAVLEQKIQAEALALAQRLEENLQRYTAAQVAASNQVNQQEVRRIAEETLANATDDIRALALQTVVDSAELLDNFAENAVRTQLAETKHYTAEQARQLAQDIAAIKVADADYRREVDHSLQQLSGLLEIKQNEYRAMSAEQQQAFDQRLALLQTQTQALLYALETDKQQQLAQAERNNQSIAQALTAEIADARVESQKLAQNLSQQIYTTRLETLALAKDAQHQTTAATGQLALTLEQKMNALLQENQRLKEQVMAQTEAKFQETNTRISALADRTTAQIAQVAQAEAAAAESRVRRFAVEQLGQVESRTLAQLASADADTRQIAANYAKEVADNLKQFTLRKVQELEVTSTATAAELAAQARLQPAEIQKIALETLAGQSDTIRALALQTLAESDNYIRTVARQAVKEGDPDMLAALSSVTRQVIYGEDSEIAFVMKDIAEDVVDRRLAQNQAYTTDGLVAETIHPDQLALAEVRPPQNGQIALHQAKFTEDWVNLRDYQVVAHVDNRTLEEILADVLKRAEPFVGPWQIDWKISHENRDMLYERFSLNAETNFEEFANYLAQYMFNTRGVPLTFNLFDARRVMVITDAP